MWRPDPGIAKADVDAEVAGDGTVQVPRVPVRQDLVRVDAPLWNWQAREAVAQTTLTRPCSTSTRCNAASISCRRSEQPGATGAQLPAQQGPDASGRTIATVSSAVSPPAISTARVPARPSFDRLRALHLSTEFDYAAGV